VLSVTPYHASPTHTLAYSMVQKGQIITGGRLL